MIYKNVEPPLAWISLGSLRCNRKLKTVVEKRLPESALFNGELFIGRDQKLRYPDFIRKELYERINQSSPSEGS